MDQAEIWNEAIEKAEGNEELAGAVELMKYQRDVAYPQGERAARNWLEWVEARTE